MLAGSVNTLASAGQIHAGHPALRTLHRTASRSLWETRIAGLVVFFKRLIVRLSSLLSPFRRPD
jgi:hypothetical protein